MLQSGNIDPVVLVYFAVSMLSSFILFITYYLVFYLWKAGSPGKLILGLRVFSVDSTDYLTVGQILLREILGKFISAILLCLGYIIIAFRRDKRGLHDFIASSHVVRIAE